MIVCRMILACFFLQLKTVTMAGMFSGRVERMHPSTQLAGSLFVISPPSVPTSLS